MEDMIRMYLPLNSHVSLFSVFLFVFINKTRVL